MSLQPRNRVWRKAFERFEYGVDHRSHVVRFGTYGIQAQGPFPKQDFMKFTAKQIEAVRRALSKKLKPDGGGGRSRRNVKVWMRIFPDRPCTRLTPESRMGKGKGDVDHFAAAVRPGQVIIEFGSAPRKVVEDAFKYAADRIPFRVRLVERQTPRFRSALERPPGLQTVLERRSAGSEARSTLSVVPNPVN
mmetsp:Transcript_11506/g.23415  ORF Transcript_11506/g.23415 Transcript_11506/m.23415 type:complete len:191 (-) Transcript_11506:2033-2605(-)